MDVKQAIQRRRAYRSLEPVEISAAILGELIQAARLAPSCFNSQPVRFVFIHDSAVLAEMKTTITKGNAWAHSASLIIAIFSRREDDCIIRDREYHQFDCGLAAAFLILRATELGLVAHPIAGFSPQRTREILGISEDDQVITLIIVGKKRERINPELTAKQVEWEKQRPARLPLEKVFFENRLRLDSAGGPNESGGKS